MHKTLWGLLGTIGLLFLLPLTSNSVNAQTNATCYNTLGEWQPAAPAPINHIEGATAVIDGKLYIFSGFQDTTLDPSNRIDIYNPATNTWETETLPRNPMPFEATHIQAAVDGQYVWIAGGFLGQHPGAPTDAVWRYDTVNDLWQAGPPLPGPRASAAFVRLGRNLHFISGLSTDRDTDFPDHWTLDLDNPAAVWQAAPPIPNPRNHMQAVTLNNRIYVVGGQTGHDITPIDVPLFSAFDGTTNSWVRLADMPEARSHFETATIVVNDRVVAFGGRNNQAGLLEMQTAVEYNPETNTWRSLRDLPLPLIAPVVQQVGDFLVLTNGGIAYNVGQQQTWISQITLVCPEQEQAPPPQQRLIDFDFSKSGALQAGGFGEVGEQVVWTVSITNEGSEAENVTIRDTVEPSLQIDRVDFDRNRGSLNVGGQNIEIFIPGLMPGDSISFNIVTTVISQSADGTIINTATLVNTSESVTAVVRVLPPVTALPATGETPAERPLSLTMMVIAGVSGMFLFGVTGYIWRKQRA